MVMGIRTAGLVVGVVALAALTIPVATVAHTSKTSSEITLSTFEDPEFTLANGMDADDSFSGQVDSQKASCKKGRTVKLFRREPSPFLIGQDETDNDGNWAVFLEDPADATYFAKVSKKRSGSGNHKHICKPDKSPNLVADNFDGPTDTDVDNFFTGPGGDCDDSDDARNPGATEIENLKDDDCDGLGDNTGANDNDGDGQTGPQDCDDTNTQVLAGAVEIHDGIDNDCDGQADEDFFD